MIKDFSQRRMPSNMKYDFGRVPQANIPRSSFKRDFSYKTAFHAGYLIPFYVDEALPGDSFNLKVSIFARITAPLKLPIMDNLHLDTHFFAVPNRLVWDNWEKFNGAQDNPADSTDFTIPQITCPSGGWAIGSLSDYFGIRTGVNGLDVSALWHRAYNLIWNEWFRDQNLQDSVVVDKDNGPDTDTDYVVLRRGKRHDYFTSCLPWPQKGDSVEIALGGDAPVFSTDAIGLYNWTTSSASGNMIGSTVNSNDLAVAPIGAPSGHGMGLRPKGASPDSSVYADLSSADAVTINELREAFQTQRILEKDARGGTRYVEIIKNHFGVTSPDFRLQRPEYLGGGSQPINVGAVPQTSESGTTKQGQLTGVGTVATQHGFTKSFVEHMLIIGLVSVRADLTYQQGIPRMFSRLTRYDFYLPSLAHLGEQAVLNKEIYAQGTSADTDVFGYQERWAEYKYGQSKITNILRSDASGSLDVWHLSQDFGSLPTLNDAFIQDNPPISRVSAVPSEPGFILDSFFSINTARPMPLYSVPGMIDHY